MPASWEAVEYILQKHYYQPDLQAARALYAAAAIHGSGERPPVWIMLIGPPGSMKTDLLDALTGLNWVFPIDNLTPNTFLSGQIGQKNSKRSSSLLHRIGSSGIITFGDFSTIMGLRHESSSTIFAACRRIYDGRYSREYGTSDGDSAWEGHITMLAACTNEIERFQYQTRSLGERFVEIWLDRVGESGAMKAMKQDKRSAKKELKAAVHEVMSKLPKTPPRVSDQVFPRLAACSEFAVTARTPIHRDPSKQIDEQPYIESATRLAECLLQITRGSALLEHRAEVNETDLWLATRVAFDCIPKARRSLLRWIMGGNVGENPLARSSAITYVSEELRVLDLITESYHLTDHAKGLLLRGHITTENILPKFYNERQLAHTASIT